MFAGGRHFHKESQAYPGWYKRWPEPGVRVWAGIPGRECFQEEEVLRASKV